jgi:transposase InsO family protein
MKQHQNQYSVDELCNTLQVSRSGYYRYLNPEISPREAETEELNGEINRIYQENKCRYGSPRVTVQLRNEGWRVGKNRVARLMKNERLIGLHAKKKRITTTDSKHNGRIAPNLVKGLEVTAPNQVWVADITYIQTQQGWSYLAAVLDLYSRKIVGWQMATNMEASLVVSGLTKAIEDRCPPKGLIVHTDRGSQYVSDDSLELVEEHDLEASMSAKGNCYDNATMESFFGTLKTEEIWEREYTTHQEARASVFEYIETYYNRDRIHTSLGNQTPESFERFFSSPAGEEKKRAAGLLNCKETINLISLN